MREDRIDALGGEFRGAIGKLEASMRRGFELQTRATEKLDKKLDRALYIGNGKPAIFTWLKGLQDWQNARDAESEERQENRQRTTGDIRRLAFELLRDAAKWALAFLLTAWGGHAGGLF